jgi:RNA polymerase sigma factor (sigma-70 family)
MKLTNSDVFFIRNTAKEALRLPQLRWLIDYDILLTREDILQYIFVDFLRERRVELLNNKTYLFVWITSRVKDLARTYEKRLEFTELEDNEVYCFEDTDTLRVNIRDALNYLDKNDIVSKSDIDLMFSYYVEGYTANEIADSRGVSRKSIESKLARLVSKHTDELKRILEHVRTR